MRSGRGAAAAAGKHVLCEKPLAMSAAEAKDMVDVCERAGVVLMEAFMYRLHPLWQRVRALVDEGAVGELLAIQASFSYRNVDPGNIRNVAAYGGGAVMDIGCYPINVARWMFDGEPDHVAAVVRRDPAFGTDVLTSAVLGFGGRQATFTCSTQIEDDQRVHLDRHRAAGWSSRSPSTSRPTGRRASSGRPAVTRRSRRTSRSSRCRRRIPTACRPTRSRPPSSTARQVPIPPLDAIGNMAVIERVLAGSGPHAPSRGTGPLP